MSQIPTLEGGPTSELWSDQAMRKEFGPVCGAWHSTLAVEYKNPPNNSGKKQLTHCSVPVPASKIPGIPILEH